MRTVYRGQQLHYYVDADASLPLSNGSQQDKDEEEMRK